MKTQEVPALSTKGQPSQRTCALTRVEVLAVILGVCVLVAVLWPARVRTGPSKEFVCLNNLHQLLIAWVSYAEDNNDNLVQNIARDIGGGHYATTANQAGSQPGQPYACWVLGDASQPDPGFITNGLIYPYVGNCRLYKCPADVKKNSVNQPTLRSYSMNGWMNGNPAWTSNCVDFKKLSGISNSLSPGMALVFVEENPATINDGYWVQNPNSPTTWIDSPAHFHINGGAMSFVDGHAQFRKWTDRNVLSNSSVGFASDPTSGDLAWVQARSTVKAQ